MIYSLALSASIMMMAQSASPEEDVLHLLQLAVPISEDSVEAFETVTSAIRTCNGAREIGQVLNAQIVEKRAIPLSSLPREVRLLLRDLPTGRASPVFGKEETTLKVLVICDRKPAQPAGNTPT